MAQNDTDGMMQNVPPQDLDAEQMVLGACLIDPNYTMSKVRVRQEDFYKTKHGEIFAAIQHIHDMREGVDLITVSAELKGKPGMDDICGMGIAAYLATLVSLVPTAANVHSHGNIVIARAKQRRLEQICRAGYAAAQNLKDPDELASELVREITALRRHDQGDIVDHRDVILDTLSEVEQRYLDKGGISGIPTGLRDLDSFLGGLQPQYYLVAGRPSMGKTALVEGIRHGAARHLLAQGNGDRVGFISIEMGKVALGLRAMSRTMRVPLGRLRRGRIHDHELEMLSSAAGEEVRLPITYAFGVHRDRAIKTIIDDMVQRLQCKIIIVDYLQLMDSDDRDGTREQEVSRHSRMFKNSVNEHGIPHVILSQLNRGLENRPDKRPMLSDLRESGALEQDADVIMFVYRDEVYHCKCPKDRECSCGKRGRAEIIIGKGRNEGLASIDLLFEGKYTSFEDGEVVMREAE